MSSIGSSNGCFGGPFDPTMKVLVLILHWVERMERLGHPDWSQQTDGHSIIELPQRTNQDVPKRANKITLIMHASLSLSPLQ